MTPALRNPCFSAILCGTALLAPPAPAQSADGAGLLTSTPQSVEDLQRIERQLQQKLPRVLPALVCIELNNGSGSGILVSEKGLVFSAAHVVDKKGTTLKIILPDGTRLPGKTTAQNSNSDAGMARGNLPSFKAIYQITIHIYILNNDTTKFGTIEDRYNFMNTSIHRLFQIVLA